MSQDNLVEQIMAQVMAKVSDQTAANTPQKTQRGKTMAEKSCSLTEFVGTAIGDTIGLVIANVDQQLLDAMKLEKRYRSIGILGARTGAGVTARRSRLHPRRRPDLRVGTRQDREPVRHRDRLGRAGRGNPGGPVGRGTIRSASEGCRRTPRADSSLDARRLTCVPSPSPSAAIAWHNVIS